MKEFIYNALPGKVVFGAGKLSSIRSEIEQLNVSKALVLSTPNNRAQAEELALTLGDAAIGVFAGAVMHVPAKVATSAVSEAQKLKADCLVAIGGGSTIGLAKAVALELNIPIVAIPTTYAGSEMTPIWGITEDGVKRTGRDNRVLPKIVIYDGDLLKSLPGAIASHSGMNAIAHCVEALYSETANPIVSLMAEEGIRAIGKNLQATVEDSSNDEAREETLYGAWLAGTALGAVGMALHHKLCHTLGGSFNLPHAEVHTVIIPYATAYNSKAAPEAVARVAKALGKSEASEAAGALFELNKSIGAKTSLAAIGMREDDLDKAADIAASNPYYNPQPVTRDAIRALLDDAFHGRFPSGEW